MNDALFEIAGQKRAFNTRELAEKVGLDVAGLSRGIRDPKIQLKLQLDIMEGLKLGITATPAFVIDGKVFLGQLPPEIIKKAIE
jgi:protein-disulfide isomerase